MSNALSSVLHMPVVSVYPAFGIYMCVPFPQICGTQDWHHPHDWSCLACRSCGRASFGHSVDFYQSWHGWKELGTKSFCTCGATVMQNKRNWHPITATWSASPRGMSGSVCSGSKRQETILSRNFELGELHVDCMHAVGNSVNNCFFWLTRFRDKCRCQHSDILAVIPKPP